MKAMIEMEKARKVKRNRIMNIMNRFNVYWWLGISMIVLCPILLSAQETEEPLLFQEISIPASPTAMALGKYGDIPVNKATGIPSISLPVTQIREGRIQVPVSINYHASGIKVEEKAGTMGLGWSLNAGGVITRSTRGIPDETTNGFKGYLSNRRQIPSARLLEKIRNPENIDENIENQIDDISNNYEEYLPDLFYFNFLDQSGQFYIGNTGEIFVQPHQKIRITYEIEEGKIARWKVVDQQGIIYTFDQVESTFYDNKGWDMPAFNSSWYLSSIEDPYSSALVRFTYNIRTLLEVDYNDALSVTFRKDDQAVNTGVAWQLTNESQTNNTVSVYNVRSLDSIIAKTGQIKVLYDDEGNIGQVHSNFFDYEDDFYFEYDEYEIKLQDPFPEAKRYRLTKFSTFYENGDKKEFLFNYNQTPIASRKSKAQDHWGFYNGADLNPNMIPPTQVYAINYGQADREPDFTYTQAGILERIYHPTGGHTHFTYEPNTYEAEKKAEDFTKFNETLSISANETENERVLAIDTRDMEFVYEGFLSASVSVIDEDVYNSVFDKGTVSILCQSDGSFIQLPFSVRPKNPFIDLPVFLQAGNEYRLTIRLGSKNVDMSANLRFNYAIEGEERTVEKIGGGLRIREIRNVDPLSATEMVKNYKYSGGYLPGGELSYYRIYQSKECEDRGYSDLPLPVKNLYFTTVNIHSNPTIGLGVSSNNVAYQQVDEYYGDLEDNIGYISSLYREILDEGFFDPPAVGKMSFQWMRTKEIGRKVYEHLNNTYAVKQEVRNEYESKIITEIRGFGAKKFNSFGDLCLLDSWYFDNVFTLRNFSNKIINERLKSTRTIDYNHFGGKPFTIDQKFYYNDRFATAPNRIETFDSYSRSIETEFFYPYDFDTDCPNDCLDQLAADLQIPTDIPLDDYYGRQQNAYNAYLACVSTYQNCFENNLLTATSENDKGILQLVDDNNISSPYKIYRKRDGQFHSESEARFFFNEDKPRRNLIYANNRKMVEPRLQFEITRYDAFDHPLEVINHTTGLIKSYHYCELSQQLMCEVVGAGFDETAYTSFEHAGEGRLIYDEDGIINVARTGDRAYQLGDTHTVLCPSLPAGNFEISFWCQGAVPKVLAGSSSLELTPEQTVDGWTRYRGRFQLAELKGVSISGSSVIDELRLHPSDAQINTVTHINGLGINSRNDTNSNSEFYHFTDNRLFKIQDHFKNNTVIYDYNFSGIQSE